MSQTTPTPDDSPLRPDPQRKPAPEPEEHDQDDSKGPHDDAGNPIQKL